MVKSGEFSKAERHFKKALGSDPQDVNLLGALAAVQVASGRLDEAVQTCETALAIDPSCSRAHALEISVFQRLGRFDEAIETCRKLLVQDPTDYRAWTEIVRSKRIESSDAELIFTLQSMGSDPNRANSDRFRIHRALGKAFDDLGRFEDAMRHFEAANQIARDVAPMPYDGLEREKELRTVKSMFPADVFQRAVPAAMEGPTPVLIVGMIRSGTTLLDSMLSRLEGIRSAGEVRFWNTQAAHCRANPSLVKSPPRLSELGRQYMGELSGLVPGEQYVIDKMPLNYRHLGFVKLALPHVKILHLRRHPVDTAISIYTSEFGPQPPPFAFDKGRIVHVYRLYLELLEHWRRVLPAGSLLEIAYERLVSDPEPVMREVLAYLGVPWSDKVLDRSHIEGDVNTPSWWQARQPVYTSSVGRWRNYLPWLGELSELLTPDEIRSGKPTE